jgi:hypothetical protein
MGQEITGQIAYLAQSLQQVVVEVVGMALMVQLVVQVVEVVEILVRVAELLDKDLLVVLLAVHITLEVAEELALLEERVLEVIAV